MANKCKVSFGLITYNHENYIEDALKSVLNIEYEDMEILILDDASKDNTKNIILHYVDKLKKKYKHVRYIFHENNTGNITRNLNEIIENTTGKYFFCAAGDDMVLPNGVKLLVKAMEDHPECSVVCANMIAIGETFHFGDAVDYSDIVIKGKESGMESEGMFQRLMLGNYIASPTVLRKRDVFQKNGLHDDTIPYEDYEYWLRISRKEKFYYLNEPVVLHRKGETSVTNFRSERGLEKLQRIMDLDYLIKEKYIHELSEDEQKTCWREYYSRYMKLCRDVGYRAGIEKLEEELRKRGLTVYEREIDSREVQKRKEKEKKLLEKWDARKTDVDFLERKLSLKRIESVAIYGYAQLGKKLEKELDKTQIRVKYIIDQKAPLLNSQKPIYTLEDKLEKVDAVIVTPTDLYESIHQQLREKCKTEIIDLTWLVLGEDDVSLDL